MDFDFNLRQKHILKRLETNSFEKMLDIIYLPIPYSGVAHI